MIGIVRHVFWPGLADTGPVHNRVFAVRDGFMNLYVIKAPAGLVCVDAGWRLNRVAREFARLHLDPSEVKAVLLTHLHFDHANGMLLFPNAEKYAGRRGPSGRLPRWPNPARPFNAVEDGESLTVGGLEVKAVATPGHCSGSMAYVIERRWLFTGDALRLRAGEALPFLFFFNRNQRKHVESIRKLAGLPGIEWLFTGHSGPCADAHAAFRRWRPEPGSTGANRRP